MALRTTKQHDRVSFHATDESLAKVEATLDTIAERHDPKAAQDAIFHAVVTKRLRRARDILAYLDGRYGLTPEPTDEPLIQVDVAALVAEIAAGQAEAIREAVGDDFEDELSWQAA